MIIINISLILFCLYVSSKKFQGILQLLKSMNIWNHDNWISQLYFIYNSDHNIRFCYDRYHENQWNALNKEYQENKYSADIRNMAKIAYDILWLFMWRIHSLPIVNVLKGSKNKSPILSVFMFVTIIGMLEKGSMFTYTQFDWFDIK